MLNLCALIVNPISMTLHEDVCEEKGKDIIADHADDHNEVYNNDYSVTIAMAIVGATSR